MLFLTAALLLPPLPIAIGDSGPHPCLVLAALGLIAGAPLWRRWRVTPSPLNGAFLALFGAMLASAAAAALYSGLPVAAATLARIGLFGISLYVFAYTAYAAPQLDARASVRWLYLIALAAAVFGCVDFYYQFPAPAGYEPQFVWLADRVLRRAQGLFYEASTLGNFCAFFLTMIAVGLTRPREESPVPRWLLAVGAILFAGALILSYSRGSLVNIFVAGAALAWLNRKRLRVARVVAVLAVCAAVTALVVWVALPGFAENYWIRLSASTGLLGPDGERLLSGRAESWRTLFAWMADNPWRTVFGIGYKTLPYTTYLGDPIVADNMYLSLLIETGVAGLAAVLWLNGAILRATVRVARAAEGLRGFLGAWMFCFWCGECVQMLSGDLLTYWRVLPVYFFVLALAVRE